MLNKIIAFSIRNKLIIALFTLGLMGYGVYEVGKLPIDAVPDITNNQVQVITLAPSFGATDIERLVTFPIEQVNNNIPGLLEIRSFSRFGLSLVTIVFDDNTDVYWARQQVAERLQQVQSKIPAGIGTPELGPVSTGLGEIYQYVVRPKKGFEKKYDATELRTIQDWIVRRQLIGVKGVAEVSSFGGKLKQYEIAVNPAKLKSYGITVNDVFSAIDRNNQNTGGAYIEKGPSVLFIRTEGLVGTIDDIKNISIKKNSGTPLFIRDVADVNIGYATRYGAMTYNDEGEVAGAVVMMLKGANSSEVIKNVKAKIEQIKKTLPEGVVLEPFLDRTKMVDNAIGTVEKNLIEGALIVIFVLVIFLGNFRAGLIVASIIPLAMLFAIILMNTFGVSGNLMSLGALDFGLIVDGAVIIVEAVMHQISKHKKFASLTHISQGEMDNEVKTSAGRMMNSAVFGQIIILIVYLPIFSLQGIEGKMFKPMAQTVAFALLGAFILSLTYIPMMSALFLSKKIKTQPNWSDRVMEKVGNAYQKTLIKVMLFPKTLIASVVGIFILALVTLSFLGGEFIPSLEEGDFAVDTRVLTGSNLTTTIESTQKAAHILKTQFPEVEKVVTKIGSGEVPTDPMPMEASDMMVILKNKKEWTSAKTFNELSEKMSKALEAVPGITAGFQYPVQMRFNELMTGARQDVVCKIFGENLDTLSIFAQKLGAIINTVKGAQNLYIEPISGIPQIIVQYNRAAIAQYGLDIADVNRVVNTSFAGQFAGKIFEGEKQFDLVVRLDTQQRKTLVDIQNLLIPTDNGLSIPLSQLASVEIKEGPNQIQREDAKRRMVVGFNIKGRDVQTIVNELQAKVNKGLKFPTGYYVTYGGAFENLNAAKNRLMVAVPLSLALIYILLFFAFGSAKQGLLIYSAIPLSAIGGIFFLALRGMPFSISAGIGFIALFGVAVLNGIVLISEFNRLKATGMDDIKRIVLEGTKTRLRPVLMTAFVASLGFLPMALSNGAGAEVQRPLATVVIGGLMVATFLTLFVLPVLYIIFEKGIKNSITKASVIFLVFFFCAKTQEVKAQETIGVQQAIDTALKNNVQIKNQRLKLNYQKILIGSSNTIPATGITGEFGQMASIYNDTRFGISQSFSFPRVYKNQKRVLQKEADIASLTVKLKENELIRLVTETYYDLLNLHKKELLLKKSDSLYREFNRKTALRFKLGESDVLEKSTAENQLVNINLQLNELKEAYQTKLIYFNYLLNTDSDLSPNLDSENQLYGGLFTLVDLKSHPMLSILEDRILLNQKNTDVEKSKLLPDINLGYFNSSMRGVGADDVLYGAGKRFQAVQIGLAIPLFTGAQRSKIKASKVNERIASLDFDQQKQELEVKFKTLLGQLKQKQESLSLYEKTVLPNARIIITTSSKQFTAGEINYLNLVMLVNQSIAIEINYLDLVKSINDIIIELNYLSSKKS
ncbi:CusA/CzcA family heavy metal efflux RND transporter [Pedobacter changchengzhani]|uniref:CusA/CzcA family heavy metal efflux RND transporter n=1 Tax=Pedobacter changchengzhani TaxID=2529274 RepID=A0A4R5MHE2_9SPHI|nr:CusA/CzcA family heavy metal efflux RND transporter [Pedobacter changchengzhani]TDG34934.1 CusA/CzcA family heavy metal efflux RND transporter [Pedobacter changchengzhani]